MWFVPAREQEHQVDVHLLSTEGRHQAASLTTMFHELNWSDHTPEENMVVYN